VDVKRERRAARRRENSTRDRIISAAEALFASTGIEKVSVADIADSAGVHRVTVYRHFADRDAVITEVVERRSLPIFERAAARLATSDRFPEDLAFAMVAAIDETRQNPGLLAAMAVTYDGKTFRTAGTSDAFVARAGEVVRSHLQTAQVVGKMRADLDLDETVNWLLHVCLSWLFLDGDASAAYLLKLCNTYVMAALVTPKL